MKMQQMLHAEFVARMSIKYLLGLLHVAFSVLGLLTNKNSHHAELTQHYG